MVTEVMAKPEAIQSDVFPRVAAYKPAIHTDPKAGTTGRAVGASPEPAQEHLLKKVTKMQASKYFQANVDYSFPSGPDPAFAAHPIFRRRGSTLVELQGFVAAISLFASLWL